MAKCGYCGSTIIVGGVKQGEQRFCNQKCHQRGMLVAFSNRIDPAEVQTAITRVHQGLCPKCGGAGPIDVSTSYRIWSAILLTYGAAVRRSLASQIAQQEAARGGA
jgi:hypothetical protein